MAYTFKFLALLAMTALIIPASILASAPGNKPDSKAPKGPPPMLVAQAPIEFGHAEPMTEMIGTAYYSRVSQVAAEVDGLVVEAHFEEGQILKKGDKLVKLGSEILETTITGTRASLQQARLELEKAEKDVLRTEPLYADKTLPEASFDEYYFRQKTLEQKSASLQSSLDRLHLEKGKKTITMPFTGIVVRKMAEKGEWVARGGSVAEVADNLKIDAIVDIPEEMLRLIKKGRKVQVTCGGKEYQAQFKYLVPKGNFTSRTFPVKFRLNNSDGFLAEGMAARVMLPSSPKVNSLIVPRDAVINKFGRDVVFINEGGMAKMIPVKVTGYQGLKAGVSAEPLKEGQFVITSGNERLRDGVPVRTASQEQPQTASGS